MDPRRPRALLAFAGLGLAGLLIAVTLRPSAPPTSPSPTLPASPSHPASPMAAPVSPTLGEPSPAIASPTAAQATPNPDEPWGRVDLPPIAPAATLVATDVDRARVATDTAFTLTSLSAGSAADLARAIVVAPSIDLAVEAGATAASATIRPTEPLLPGRIYRFTLRAPDGTISGSWAFQAPSPLRVVTTLPYDQATDVPVATGIELTFDQDGTVDAASHFSIEPAVKGRFEQHGRTFVFVPERLEPATLYTVTLGRGVRLKGSDQALEQDVVVRFETAPPAEATRPSVSYQFSRPTMEWRPGDRPVVAIRIWSAASWDEEQQAIREQQFPVAVYRLPSERAGTDAVRTLTEAVDWTVWDAGDPVPTKGLARVQSFDAEPMSDTDGSSWFRFPAPLQRGWYLVEVPRPAGSEQMILQVTDVAGYVAAANDRLLVWANDISTGGPLQGATVEMYGGGAIGRTGPDGLLVATTPSEIRDPFLAVRATGGRSLVIPVGLSDLGSRGDPDAMGDRLWRFMATDRQTYRQTDTVNVWGFVRQRDSGRVPPDLELRLTSGWSWTGTDDAPPIATVPVHPDATGAFAESTSFNDLPFGAYSLQLWSGGDRIADTWFSVELIRKPAYQVAVETDRHVLLAGESVTLTARATFFDGLAVPGVRLTAGLFGERKIATDRAGVATATANAPTSRDGYENWVTVSVQPTRGEEGEISGSTSLLVSRPAFGWTARARSRRVASP